MPELTVHTSGLHYYRCQDCLGAFTIRQEDLPGTPSSFRVTCLCGGNVVYMGRVHDFHYEKEGERAPCDERCTNAAGPKCTCQCGCKNHGTKRLVTVVVERGALRITKDDPGLMQKGNSWRNLVEEIQTSLDSYSGPHKYELINAWRHVQAMRVYSSRDKKARAILAQMKPVTLNADDASY